MAKMSFVLEAAGRVIRTKCGAFAVGAVGKTSRMGLLPAKARNAVLSEPLAVLVMLIVAAWSGGVPVSVAEVRF